ncbi:MAG: MFS transporter [Anaerolineae bacterium]|nr:MFS transporter [Anaerolineae bacterium]
MPDSIHRSIIVQSNKQPHLRHNFAVNVMDGTFFGFGMYAASYQTVLPLFFATLTDSALLIGLIGSIHFLGWQLPQMFTVGHVARLRRYKRFVLMMTIQERIPYIGLLLIALASPHISRELALVAAFLMVMWQGLGSGLTATGWQSMIAKIMPDDMRGRFYGAQSSMAQGMGVGGALLAGFLLERLDSPWDYAACFAVAALGMAISFGFLAQTRESEHEVEQPDRIGFLDVLRSARTILKRDANFRWFTIVRILAQVAMVAQSFFAIFALRRFGIQEDVIAGVMTTVLLVAQALSNPLLGWLGDRFGHRYAVIIGVVAAICSALFALFATGAGSFYFAFALSGVASGALWTTVLAMTAEFGTPAERPYYIGLSNTLVAPATLLIPVFTGWLVEQAGFASAFAFAAFGGVLALIVAYLRLRDPVPRQRGKILSAPAVGD